MSLFFQPTRKARNVTNMETLSYSPKKSDPVGKILLSDRDATDTARLLKLLAGPPGDPLIALAGKFRGEDIGYETGAIGSRSILIAAAKKILISRRSRSQFFDESIFSEPAWDMLLALYITEVSEARHSIARLTEFAGAAPTTSLRWISHL